MAASPEPEPTDPQSGSGEAYQSLYRRYRPQRFEDVRGQEHVTRALQNSVRDGRVAHAYLFSGPRGTGKTTTARILAMALNCEHPVDGEPDGVCASCVEIRRGSSMDVQELDAASNRKLDEMRDLLSRVALGTRGRWKVYIIDEVHQLTGDAASALLKTLEEPPGHVVFVLATTDPQKVLETIRSRTQHFEFRLLSTGVLESLLRDVNAEADLGVTPEAIDAVVRRGRGSARDALSVLDQVAAAGGVDDEAPVVAQMVDAVADRDAGAVLVAVAEAMASGRDPRRVAADLLEHLRNGFLVSQAPGLVMLGEAAAAAVGDQARRLGLARLVRSMEVIGQASADMRDAVDPRITLEVALVRLAAPAVDDDRGALLDRVARLEHLVAEGAGVSPAGVPSAPPAAPSGAAPAPGDVAPSRAVRAPGSGAFAGGSGAGGRGPEAPDSPPGVLRPAVPGSPSSDSPAPGVAGLPGAPSAPTARPGPRPRPQPAEQALSQRVPPPPPAPGRPGPTRQPALGAHRARSGPPSEAPPGFTERAPTTSAAPPAEPPSEALAAAPSPPAPAAELPSRDELTTAWGDRVLAGLRPGVKVYLLPGRFVAVDGGQAVFALPDRGLLARAEPVKGEAEAALAAHFGRSVPLRLVLDDGAVPVDRSGPPEPDRGREPLDEEDLSPDEVADLEDAGPAVVSAEQRLLQAFPGAEEVTP